MTNEGEKILKTEFQRLVEKDFIIYPEVNGKYLISGKNVVIDFLLHPKPHLLEYGFDPVWFGLKSNTLVSPVKLEKCRDLFDSALHMLNLNLK